MKRLLPFFFLFLLVFPAYSQEVVLPEQQGVVSDYADQLSADTKARIEEVAKELKRVTSINLAVCVVRTTLPLDAVTYGKRLYNKWDVGNEKEGFSHGILLLVAILDREARIIPGKGIEFVLNKENREKLEFGMYPYLGSGKITFAVYVGAVAVSQFVTQEWAKTGVEGGGMSLRNVLLAMLGLLLVSIMLTLSFDGGFMMFFGMFAGGIFGLVLLGYPGMLIGSMIGFLINLGGPSRKATFAEKQLKKVYDEWKGKQKPGTEEEKSDENKG